MKTQDYPEHRGCYRTPNSETQEFHRTWVLKKQSIAPTVAKM